MNVPHTPPGGPSGRDANSVGEPEAGSALETDLLLISNYFSNELPEPEAMDVERRIQEDPTFWEHVEPIVSFMIIRRRLGLGHRPESVRAPVAPSLSPSAPVRPALVPVRPRPEPPPVVLPQPWVPPRTPSYEPRTGKSWRHGWRLPIYVGIAASVIATFVIAGPSVVRGVKDAMEARPLPQGVVDQLKGRANTEGPFADSVVNTDSIETTTIHLEAGGSAILRPGSRFTYEVNGQLYSHKHFAALDGEAVLDIRQLWELHTAQATMMLEPGLYAIRSDTLGTGMLLSVGSGRAKAWHVGEGTDTVIVHRGEYLRIPHIGMMLLSNIPEGFPSLTESRKTVPPVTPIPPVPHNPHQD